jgi:hypothetical protein
MPCSVLAGEPVYKNAVIAFSELGVTANPTDA